MHLKIIKFAAYYKQENKTISPYLKGGGNFKRDTYLFLVQMNAQSFSLKHTHTQQAQKKS